MLFWDLVPCEGSCKLETVFLNFNQDFCRWKFRLFQLNRLKFGTSWYIDLTSFMGICKINPSVLQRSMSLELARSIAFCNKISYVVAQELYT